MPPTTQIPGLYHHRIGDIVVTAVSDGYMDGSLEVMRDIAPADATQMLADAFRPSLRLSVNCYLIQAAGRLALVDTGSGAYLGPTMGKLQQNLAVAGIAPDAIDAVLLTHIHPDHSNGLTDPQTGAKLFPNAELIVHRNEPAHWLDDATMNRAGESARYAFDWARTQVTPYRDRMRTFAAATEVFPGVTALPLPGHTPGHSGYVIASGNQSLLIWGDIVHVPEVQVPRPEVTMTFDIDPSQAAASRRRAFDMAATDKLLVGGMHLHFPGFAHLAKHGEAYRLVPAPWDQAFGG